MIERSGYSTHQPSLVLHALSAGGRQIVTVDNDRARLEGVTVKINEVPTLVYTIEKHKNRHVRCTEIMAKLGFSNWRFEYGTPKVDEPYWKPIRKDYVRMLRTLEPPILILEDDIAVREFKSNLQIPRGTQLAYLGGGSGADARGSLAARKHVRDKPIIQAHNYTYQDWDATWMRIFGMLYTHACLWLDKAVMLDAADRIERSSALVDNVLACEQWRWRVLCLKVPMFWQNDGHHKHKEKTYDYFTPVMFKNRHTGTFPVVFHACGNTRNPGNSMWQQIRDWCFDRESVPDPKTEVFVPCNRPDCIAEQLLVKNKQPHRVLGREIRAWKNYMKHQLLLCAARSSKYEYVMSMDGLDVAYRGVFSNCRRVLEKSGKQMLLCGDWIGVPNAKSPPWAREIERQGGGHHPYLNAGVWIAKRRFAIEFLQKAVADHKQYGNDHEQIAYHRLWDSATMAIDRQCEVFQTYLCGSELVNVGCPDTWLTGRQSARSRREQVLRRA